MSKKDKSKFRRRLKAQILQEMAKVQPAGKPATASIVAQPISPPKTESALGDATAKPEPAPAPGAGLPVGASLDTLQLVRHDLKKSAIIIGSIIILIVLLYYADLKTGILLKVGNEIFKVLHIGGQ